jgi:hypothetical protein
MTTNTSHDTSQSVTPARKHSGKTHRTRLARTLATETGLGYQKCLSAVVAAADSGALPTSLDKDGMAAAARILRTLIPAKSAPVALPARAAVPLGSSLLFSDDRAVRVLVAGTTQSGKTTFAKAAISDFRDAHPDGQVLVLTYTDLYSSRYRIDEEPGLEVCKTDNHDPDVVARMQQFAQRVTAAGGVGLVVTDTPYWLGHVDGFADLVNGWESVSLVLTCGAIFGSVRDSKGDVNWTHRVLTSPRQTNGSGVFTEEWAEPVAATPSSVFPVMGNHSVMESAGNMVRLDITSTGVESFLGSEIGSYRFTEVVAFENWTAPEVDPAPAVIVSEWTDAERRDVLTGLRRLATMWKATMTWTISEAASSALIADCREERAAALFTRVKETGTLHEVIETEPGLFGSWASVLLREAHQYGKLDEVLGALVETVEKELAVSDAERRQQATTREISRVMGVQQ